MCPETSVSEINVTLKRGNPLLCSIVTTIKHVVWSAQDTLCNKDQLRMNAHGNHSQQIQRHAREGIDTMLAWSKF
jgi:hypothetical protein